MRFREAPRKNGGSNREDDKRKKDERIRRIKGGKQEREVREGQVTDIKRGTSKSEIKGM